MCPDTDKLGKYFSLGKVIPLGMVLEYAHASCVRRCMFGSTKDHLKDTKKMYLCKFELVDDVTVYEGKYSFRDLEMERFYETPAHYPSRADRNDDDFSFNVEPTQSYNHYDGAALPIYDEIFSNPSRKPVEGFVDRSEVFIGAHDLHKVRPAPNFEPRSYTAEEAYEVLDKLVPKVN